MLCLLPQSLLRVGSWGEAGGAQAATKTVNPNGSEHVPGAKENKSAFAVDSDIPHLNKQDDTFLYFAVSL